MDESHSTPRFGAARTSPTDICRPESPESPSSPHQPGSTTCGTMSANQCHTVLLFGIPIAAIYIDGKERLCLAQISNTLLKQFSYNEIHNRRVALGVTCVQCTPVQLEMLRRAGAMPVSSRRCGMITKREAERLCKSFLFEARPPKLPDNFAFDVYHECAWGCRGDFVPSRYNSSRAKCIKCCYCGLYFSPNKFIFHTHRIADSKYRHPDAANFNSWRRHIHLVDRSPEDDLLQAWEDVKAMFNGGSRKRSNPTSSSSPSTPSPHSSSHQSSAPLSPSPPLTKRKRMAFQYPDSEPALQMRPGGIDPRIDFFSSVNHCGTNIHTPQPSRPSTPSMEDNTVAAAQLYASNMARLRQQFSAHAVANRNMYAEYLSNGGKFPYPLAHPFWPKTPSIMPLLGNKFPKELPVCDMKTLSDQRINPLSKESLSLVNVDTKSCDENGKAELDSWEKIRLTFAEQQFQNNHCRDMKIPGKSNFNYGSAFRPVMTNGNDVVDSAMALRSQSSETNARNDSAVLNRVSGKPNMDSIPAEFFRFADPYPRRDFPSAGIPAKSMDFARYFLDDRTWCADGKEDATEGAAFMWRQQREKRLDDLLFRVARKECERRNRSGATGEGKQNQTAVIQHAEATTSCESPDKEQESTSGADRDMPVTGPDRSGDSVAALSLTPDSFTSHVDRSGLSDIDTSRKASCATSGTPQEGLTMSCTLGETTPEEEHCA